jgi:hypothetical protein
VVIRRPIHEWPLFNEGGTVTDLHGSGDSVVATKLQWRLANGRLELYDGKRAKRKLSLIFMSSDAIVVRTESGELVDYLRVPVPNQA